MTKIRVAVVTVTYNSAPVIDDFLETIGRQIGAEICLYVVDNASADSTVEIVERFKDSTGLKVAITRNDDNRGVAAANNQGIVAARADNAEWVVLMNNDTYSASPTFFTDLIATARSLDVATITPIIAATEPPETLWFGAGSLYRWKGYQTKHDLIGIPMTESTNANVVTDYAPTCCLLISSEVFDTVGLMDEDFFVYGDDVDFAIRLRDHGHRPVVAGEIELAHKASSLTGGFLSDFTVRWFTRNWVLVMRKHATWPELVTGTTFMQVWMLSRLITGRDSPRHYWHRQKAWIEGWRQQIINQTREEGQ